MDLHEAQKKVAEFDKARGWDDSWDLKDLLLNICEETGELWNLVKWIKEDEQKKVVAREKSEVEDFVGDVLFLVLKIANQSNVDVEKGLIDVLEEYEQRMPADKMKEVGHSNKLAGGIDDKK